MISNMIFTNLRPNPKKYTITTLRQIIAVSLTVSTENMNSFERGMLTSPEAYWFSYILA